MTLLITGLPRSGTSLTSSLVVSSGYDCSIGKSILGASDLNKNGYFEDIDFILFNDQLIRFCYGNNYSFLYPPKAINENQCFEDFNNSWEYDITEQTLDIPDDYISNIEFYSNLGWDVWGISRMKKDCKWNMCYSKRFIENKHNLISKLNFYRSKINKIQHDFFLKDPRLVFTLPIIAEPEFTKVIILSRGTESNFKSIKTHYGKRMFTDNNYPGTNWVSNHFNLKVGFTSESQFLHNYQIFIDNIKKSFQTITLSFEKILEKKCEIDRLENFIGSKVDRSLID